MLLSKLVSTASTIISCHCCLYLDFLLNRGVRKQLWHPNRVIPNVPFDLQQRLDVGATCALHRQHLFSITICDK
jgi:hypothetical protein